LNGGGDSGNAGEGKRQTAHDSNAGCENSCGEEKKKSLRKSYLERDVRSQKRKWEEQRSSRVLRGGVLQGEGKESGGKDLEGGESRRERKK